jgi:pimeloyl-ACP methyl ester carboxylesterase
VVKIVMLAILAIGVAACSDERVYDYEIHANAGVPEYGLIDRGNAPLAFVFASDIDQSLTGKDTVPIAQHLARAGFSVVAMDLPSHHPGEEPHALSGWRQRIDAGETDIFTSFCDDVSAVLDDLHASKASVVGISRGAYVAIVCGARDERFRNLALLAPVTDLGRLSEFGGAILDPAIYGLSQYVPILSTRNILVRIGRNDTRVGTDAAIAFAQSVGADLRVVNVEGHSVKEDGSTTQWLWERR